MGHKASSHLWQTPLSPESDLALQLFIEFIEEGIFIS
jgi:hypothetical protein